MQFSKVCTFYKWETAKIRRLMYVDVLHSGRMIVLTLFQCTFPCCIKEMNT